MEFIVIFGGESWEHEISIVSAITLKKELKNIAHFVFIDAENEAYLVPHDMMKSTHFSTLAYKKDAKLTFTKGGFLQSGLLKKQILRGVAINLIHGKSGEDGQLAGILDFYEIPFIGPRIEGSVVSFNKEMTKIYAKSIGVRVLEYLTLGANAKLANAESSAKISLDASAESKSAESSAESKSAKSSAESANAESSAPTLSFGANTESKSAESSAESAHTLTFPCIVKPLHLGSSIGIAVAKSRDDLTYALDCAFEFDNRVIIEPFIPHIREFNLAGCKINGEFVFSMIEEVKKDEFLDFKDKYLDFQSGQKKQGADLDEDLQNKIKADFAKIYNDCFEGALIRCDFFLLNDEIYLNEINPIPGSLAHYLFDDLNAILQNLSQNLPKTRKIPLKYQYISKIQAQKGK